MRWKPAIGLLLLAHATCAQEVALRQLSSVEDLSVQLHVSYVFDSFLKNTSDLNESCNSLHSALFSSGYETLARRLCETMQTGDEATLRSVYDIATESLKKLSTKS